MAGARKWKGCRRKKRCPSLFAVQQPMFVKHNYSRFLQAIAHVLTTLWAAFRLSTFVPYRSESLPQSSFFRCRSADAEVFAVIFRRSPK